MSNTRQWVGFPEVYSDSRVENLASAYAYHNAWTHFAIHHSPVIYFGQYKIKVRLSGSKSWNSFSTDVRLDEVVAKELIGVPEGDHENDWRNKDQEIKYIDSENYVLLFETVYEWRTTNGVRCDHERFSHRSDPIVQY